MNSRYEVNVDGIYYDDIDWDKDIHCLGTHCPVCKSDGAEGHQAGCPYLWSMQQTGPGRDFLQDQICNAIERERLTGNIVTHKAK